MTDQQDTSETEDNSSETVEATDAGEAKGESESEAKDDDDAKKSEEDRPSDDDADDDDADDDDDDEPKKPKKVKISYEAAMPRSEAISYFEAIVGGLRSGRLEFRQEGDTLILNPPDQLEIEVKAQRKGDKAKVTFAIEWSGERPLEILN